MLTRRRLLQTATAAPLLRVPAGFFLHRAGGAFLPAVLASRTVSAQGKQTFPLRINYQHPAAYAIRLAAVTSGANLFDVVQRQRGTITAITGATSAGQRAYLGATTEFSKTSGNHTTGQYVTWAGRSLTPASNSVTMGAVYWPLDNNDSWPIGLGATDFSLDNTNGMGYSHVANWFLSSTQYPLGINMTNSSTAGGAKSWHLQATNVKVDMGAPMFSAVTLSYPSRTVSFIAKNLKTKKVVWETQDFSGSTGGFGPPAGPTQGVYVAGDTVFNNSRLLGGMGFSCFSFSYIGLNNLIAWAQNPWGLFLGPNGVLGIP